ncbi:hypothetical protein PFICI_03888 [Pestalotiopsis fici W106-1]|uniref:Glucose-methanol-choline oxidoreductase N-terminal domain-containing protein n=1 Tax=Pestalotiopsis fici (strain W106-1 / CGMCC3.15140) TaxID=1229662 RepID=W3XIG6_PESFW|nr:uncharacterized protein PFICI_03888 [Pestalotiopsis fici W106-1]ETS85863.1 hypothetical protein PFICI_03888 [Pestalotiopsis fici W106-1]
MGLYTVLPESVQEVDIIIAGGGTSGCIVASRLADADPNLSILVIEHGPNNQNNPLVTHPLLWRAHLAPQTGTTIYYIGKNEAQLGNRGIYVAAGGVLGGGSSINLSMYTRPQANDYDAWKSRGWSSNDLIPYINKVETYHGDGLKEHHGHNGPIHVSSGPYRQNGAERNFISSMNQLGYSENKDLQDLDSSTGVSHCLKYASADGTRQDVAHAYLHPRIQDGRHDNLEVLLESQVTKVLFDTTTNRALGVEYRANPAFSKEAASQPPRRVNARQFVVLSCGTLGNPPILERSGVGDTKILENAGVPVVADVPGVGNGYQDHQVISYHYMSSMAMEETSDIAFRDPATAIGSLLMSQSPILGWNGFDASSKIRPTETEVASLGQDFQNAWDKDFKDLPSKPLGTVILSTGLLDNPATFPEGVYFSLGCYNSYPYSRGHIHITGPAMDDALGFETGFLADHAEIDLKTHIWLFKKQREVARRMNIYKGEVEGHQPAYPTGSSATFAPAVPTNNRTLIGYTEEDDAAIGDYIRKNITTCWHGLGTCKMAPREEQLGVVDERLNVYGVKGLKIADLSIAPRNVSANTNNTALTIGEKAADLIIQDLGLI